MQDPKTLRRIVGASIGAGLGTVLGIPRSSPRNGSTTLDCRPMVTWRSTGLDPTTVKNLADNDITCKPRDRPLPMVTGQAMGVVSTSAGKP